MRLPDALMFAQLALGCLQQPRPEAALCESSAEAIEALRWLNIPRKLWSIGLHLLQKQADARQAADAQEQQACTALAQRILAAAREHVDTWTFPTSSLNPFHPIVSVQQAAHLYLTGSAEQPVLVDTASCDAYARARLQVWTLSAAQDSALKKAAVAEHLEAKQQTMYSDSGPQRSCLVFRVLQ